MSEFGYHDLRTTEQIFDMSFHPTHRDVLATGHIDGSIEIYKIMPRVISI